MCLCRLHYFCIDAKDKDAPTLNTNDANHAVRYVEALNSRFEDSIAANEELIWRVVDRMVSYTEGSISWTLLTIEHQPWILVQWTT